MPASAALVGRRGALQRAWRLATCCRLERHLPCLIPWLCNVLALALVRCRRYHSECVDTWLANRHPICPVCKADAHARTPDSDVEAGAGAGAAPPWRRRGTALLGSLGGWVGWRALRHHLAGGGSSAQAGAAGAAAAGGGGEEPAEQQLLLPGSGRSSPALVEGAAAGAPAGGPDSYAIRQGRAVGCTASSGGICKLPCHASLPLPCWQLQAACEHAALHQPPVTTLPACSAASSPGAAAQPEIQPAEASQLSAGPPSERAAPPAHNSSPGWHASPPLHGASSLHSGRPGVLASGAGSGQSGPPSLADSLTQVVADSTEGSETESEAE